MVRVSERQRYEIANNRIEKAKNQNAKMLDILSSMKTIREISDDPVGNSRALRYKDRISTMGQHQKNIDLSKGFVQKTEDSIAALNENVMRAKELAISMASDTYNAEARNATAREIREIINEVILNGNAQFGNRFIFSGFRNTQPALSTDGDFLGDDGLIYLEVSEGNYRQINIQSRYLFEATPEERTGGHFNLLDALQGLYDSLVANDKGGIQKMVSELDFQLDKTTSFQASLGGLWTALEQTSGRLGKERDFSKATLSVIEDADAFDATSDFKRTEAVLQSTLLASNKLLQPSLLNFLQ